MWTMSDRAIPRSYRMMEGFGVHTFRFINGEGVSHFVKFHWKPKLGTHAVVWDEAQKISGKNPDFHREDLWEAIDMGHFPEWELGVQIVPDADEHKFDFDLLDPTKIIPEELVPVTIIGRMVLNRNPDNFFAETEQIAFHPGHIVPGIDFTNDPLLQGRLFSYTDTQLSRLGGPNFHEIPINRAIAPVHNNQRDGMMRQEINVGRVNYHPNSLGGGCPYQAMMSQGGFTSHNERIDAVKIRGRSESFSDHFSQARLFFDSQTEVEQMHIIRALRFELGKVETMAIRARMLGLLSQIDMTLAEKVAKGLGMPVPPQPERPMNHGVSPDTDPLKHEPKPVNNSLPLSDALSMVRNPTVSPTIESRKVAILCADGLRESSVLDMKTALLKNGAKGLIIAPHMGFVSTDQGGEMAVDFSFLTASSVLFDAVYIPGGSGLQALAADPDVLEFINDAYKHCKVIAADAEGIELISGTNFASKTQNASDAGLILESEPGQESFADQFITAMGAHRIWERESIQ